jgi:tRNA A-37 threonylcarbamoyl transferase component Bud32
MLTFASTTVVRGELPSALQIADLLDRQKTQARAVEVYDTQPNLVARLSTGSGDYVIKWFGWRHPIHDYLSPSFPSRAEATWTIAQALLRAGCRTPTPILVYTRRRRGRIRENFILMQAVHPHQTLRTLLKNEPDPERLTAVITDLAQSLARMHTAGIRHRDLTTGNFLVDTANAVYIVDLNRAQLLPALTHSHRCRDLARIRLVTGYPDRDRIVQEAFFHRYAELSGISEEQIRTGYADQRRRLLQRRRRKRGAQRLLHRQ